MQSFLAYQRFGKRVQQQYDCATRKAEVLGCSVADEVQSAEEVGSDTIGEHREASIKTESFSSVHGNDYLLDPELGEQPPVGNRQSEEAHGKGGCEDRTDLERHPTQQSIARIHTFGTRMGNVLTGVEIRTLTREATRTKNRRIGQSKDEAEKSNERQKVFVVGWESDQDKMDPHNWPKRKRIMTTIIITMIGFIVGFGSSIDSAAVRSASEDMGVSEVTEIFASTGIYLIGFGIGALFAGPISETVGRNPVYVVTLFVFMIWIMASALAPNIGAQIVFRFLAGFFGSTPLTCAGGSLSDIWNPLERVYAFPVFANAAFMGPILGPVVGGFVGQSALVSWRWTEWITLIISGVILTLVVLLQPETYAPVLLKWKAEHLRKITGDDRYIAEVEIRADTFWVRIQSALYRPFLLISREPIVILFALYLTVIYIVLFTFLDGYAFIFGETYGFSEGLTGLAFVGIAVGLCFASLWLPLLYHWAKRDLMKAKAEGRSSFPPEQRLWFAMFGAPAVPISLFWMGWTNYASISYWSALTSSVMFGYGILCIFISTYQYIIDSYETYAASALASLTMVRYLTAGGMTVVGIPFYKNLGVHWTLTILGAISAVMVPVPYLFFWYGPRIRAMSKYAQSGL